jgi:hypothetical protein
MKWMRGVAIGSFAAQITAKTACNGDSMLLTQEQTMSNLIGQGKHHKWRRTIMHGSDGSWRY